MDESLHQTYTSSDVMRTTEPVIAPVATDPLVDRAPRIIDEPGAPMYERSRTDIVDAPRAFSFGSSFFGWNVAAFWTLVLTGIILGLLGSTAYNTAVTNNGTLNLLDITNLTTAGFVGFLVATLLAYFLGGFVAGRMARWSGAANGAGVALWGVFVSILLAVVGVTLANTYNLGYYAQVYNVNWSALTNNAIIGIVLTLVVMFAGGILGGLVGARKYVAMRETTTRTGVYRRGRPL